MPNFIQCLIQGHKDTDKEAIKLYREADKRARAKAEASEQRIYAGDEVAEELGLLLTSQLDAVDLQDQEVFENLKTKNWNWVARVSGDDVGYCATMQMILNGILPECQQQQREDLPIKCDELLAECKEYKNHLKLLKQNEVEKIRSEIRNKGGYHLIKSENKKTRSIDQQIEAVKLLIGALKADGAPPEKLQNFQIKYNENKKIIESGHDTAADHFKKVVKSILLLFKGKMKEISSLWKSQAEKLVEKVPEGFKPVKKPYTKI
jgi:hypothetical protein